MASNFDLYSVGRIVFGRGQITRLVELAAPLGTRALIVHNGSDAVADRVAQLLTDAKIRADRIRQRGEPTVADVDRGLSLARESGTEFIVGLGGSSAIDAAKAIAGLLTNGGSALDYMEVVGLGRKVTRNAAPWIAIPTTAGTGAEVTRNAVIGAPEHKFKASIRDEQLLPRLALIDPELGVDVPPAVTAASGMDALCQLIEAFTSIGAQPTTDALAIQGIPLAARALRRAFADGSDLDARQDMALAALWSGIALTNAGLGAVHGFAAPLGANFPAPHGVICAALLPHVIEANVTALRAAGPKKDHVLKRYAQVGRALAADATLDDAAATEAAIRETQNLVRDLRIPSLSQFGLTDSDVAPMALLARRASSMRYNPVELPDHALQNILRKAVMR